MQAMVCSFEVGAVVLMGTAPARSGRAHKVERATVRTTLCALPDRAALGIRTAVPTGSLHINAQPAA
ncbi:hypothetical protein ADK51_02385 [Streptomyces sp. WM6368]|nr:hypothetical protein ADK51_02385 [Streptomyces sp. WM6368]